MVQEWIHPAHFSPALRVSFQGGAVQFLPAPCEPRGRGLCLTLPEATLACLFMLAHGPVSCLWVHSRAAWLARAWQAVGLLPYCLLLVPSEVLLCCRFIYQVMNSSLFLPLFKSWFKSIKIRKCFSLIQQNINSSFISWLFTTDFCGVFS